MYSCHTQHDRKRKTVCRFSLRLSLLLQYLMKQVSQGHHADEHQSGVFLYISNEASVSYRQNPSLTDEKYHLCGGCIRLTAFRGDYISVCRNDNTVLPELPNKCALYCKHGSLTIPLPDKVLPSNRLLHTAKVQQVLPLLSFRQNTVPLSRQMFCKIS